MAIKRIKQGAGLWTDVAALDAPEGAMRTADNVMCHRPGILEPRPGIGDTTGVAARTTDYRPIRLYAYDGDLFAQSFDGSDYRFERVSVATVIDADCPPPDTTIVGTSSAAESRGSLYVCTDTGVRKISDKADTAMKLAGVKTDYYALSSTVHVTTLDRYAIAADDAVAYRYVWVSTDANGYVRRSAPSSRWTAASSATAWVLFDRVYLPTGIVAGDKIEIYRTPGSGDTDVTPGEDYYLAVTHTITSGEVSAGYVAKDVIVDYLRDSQLGAALYTSSSQGGAENANNRPPLASCIADFGGVMWFGNTQSRHLLVLGLNSVYDSSDAGHDISGLHFSSRTGTVSVASAIVTALSGVDGMRTGMFVTDAATTPEAAGAAIPIGTTITQLRSFVTLDGTLNAGTTLTIFGRVFTWSATPTDELYLGVSIPTSSATNLTALLNDMDFTDYWGQTVTIAVTDLGGGVVQIVADQGYGVELAGTGPGQTFTYGMTMSAASTDVGAKTIKVHDTIVINGLNFWTTADGQGASPSNDAASLAASRVFGVATDGSGATDNEDLCVSTIQQLADAINAYGIITAPTWGVRAIYDGDESNSIILIRDAASQAAFSVSAATNCGDAFTPNLGGSGATTESTRRRNRLYWSRLQQPEAVGELDYTDIGRSDRNILALVALDNALLIFKEDGVYRLTGSAPNQWVVDEIDTGKRLLAPSATTVLDNVCFALTDRGVFPIMEAGIAENPISLPIGDRIRTAQALLPLGSTASKRPFWMDSHPRLGLVILAAGSDNSGATAEHYGRWLVWSKATGAWTRWYPDEEDDNSKGWQCSVYDPATSRLAVGGGTEDWRVLFERTSSPLRCDRSVASITQSNGGVVGGYQVVQITIPSGIPTDTAPVAGDAWISDGVVYRIRDVEESFGAWNITLDTGSLGTLPASGTWLEGYDMTMLWQAQHLAGLGQRWQELHLEMGPLGASENVPALIAFEVGAAAHMASTSTVSLSVSGYAPLSAPLRVGLPRAVVRTPHLYPALSTRCAGQGFDLTHLYLHHTTTGRRVARSGVV